VAHCLVLNRLEPDTLAAIRAGTLLVPGGYPEKWAQDHEVPFPPPPVAVAAGEGPSAAAALSCGSPGSAEASAEATAEARVLDGAASVSGPPERVANGSSQPSEESDGTVANGGSGAESRAGVLSPSLRSLRGFQCPRMMEC